MSRYYGGWAPYVPIAERRRKAARELENLRKKGHPVAPVNIAGYRIAATFWGKAWCDNLENYRDYENRLPRGRSYVRNGAVVDLQIEPRSVKAMVSGSSLYHVTVSIGAVPKAQWQSICVDCAGEIDSLVELLQGRFAKGMMERICRQRDGLFPKPSDIRFSCSCPDYASMCKHVAAVLYGIGARLDEKPELLFRLRSVNENDLVANIDQALPVSKKPPGAGRLLGADDVADIFGLDMVEAESPIEAGGITQAAGQPPGGPRLSGASRKVSAQKNVSSHLKVGSGGKASPKRAAQKKAAAHKQAKKAPPEAVPGRAAADPPAKQAIARTSTSAKSAGKVTPVPKARAPQPVKWWLPSYRAKAQTR